MSFGVFLLPLVLAILAGLLFPLGLLLDLVAPATAASLFAWLQALPSVLRTPYLAALSVPVFALSVTAVVAVGWAFVRRRRRFAEAFESPLDAVPGRTRLSRLLWEVARGSAISPAPPSREELGRRYVALLAENLGQPGFRELILRTADLDLGAALPFVVLQEPHREAFAAARARGAAHAERAACRAPSTSRPRARKGSSSTRSRPGSCRRSRRRSRASRSRGADRSPARRTA